MKKLKDTLKQYEKDKISLSNLKIKFKSLEKEISQMKKEKRKIYFSFFYYLKDFLANICGGGIRIMLLGLI